MYKEKKYKLIWGMLAICVGIDIWLLYGKVGLQQKVTRLQAKTMLQGGVMSMMADQIQFTPGEEKQNEPKQSLKLVALFTDYGCSHCAQAETRYLNQWQKSFPGSLQVYYTGSSKGYLENFGAKFEYRNIQSVQNLFTVSLPVGNPIVLMVDKKDNVQAIHTNDTSRPGSDQRRAAFWKRMTSLFTSVYGAN